MWHLENIKPLNNYVFLENVFTKEQCEYIIRLGESLVIQDSSTVGGLNYVRNSKNSWITPSKESEGIFRHLTDFVKKINEDYFQLDLTSIESLQFTKYEPPVGRYDFHKDTITTDNHIRKLSMIIQLSNPNDYEGGELSILHSEYPLYIKKQQGSLLSFPSDTVHGVMPVTKGIRYSLVVWIMGPKLK